MAPIGEGEQVEFDGIRRRRTISSAAHPDRTATIVRQKTIHPPLGMSHFPDDDSDDDTSYHPGFFQRLRSRGKSTSSSHPPSVGLANIPPTSFHSSLDGASDKGTYAPALQSDTAYKPHETTIHFGDLPHPNPDRPSSSTPSLGPPKPPPHIAKRQFSFQNVFGRHRGESGGEASLKRPVSKGSRKGSRDGKTATEEERLGLVKGDSRVLLPIPSAEDVERDGALYGGGEWASRSLTSSPGVSPGRGPSGVRRVGTEGSEVDDVDEKEKEWEKTGGSAFL